ncbi:SHOCT domain-containing protein, partial [Methylobacterium trifolii]
GEWWPAGLGTPSTAGSQDGMRYAYFPESRRLAIESGAGIDLYDTGEHRISGVSQSNGTLGFTGPHGTIALDRLKRIEAEAAAPRQSDPAGKPPAGETPASAPEGDVIATIERLAALLARGVLTEREFSDKKAELLARL